MIKKENSKVILSSKRQICSEIVEFVTNVKKVKSTRGINHEINNQSSVTEEELKFHWHEDSWDLQGYIIDIKSEFKGKVLQDVCKEIEAELFGEDLIDDSISSLARNLSKFHFDKSEVGNKILYSLFFKPWTNE